MTSSTSPLVSMPVEALALTTSYLTAHEILGLIVCGNSQLLTRLGPRGGVQELDIDFWPFEDVNWLPGVSLFAQLRSFRCHININPVKYSLHGMDLYTLAPVLRILDLNFTNLWDVLRSPSMPSMPQDEFTVDYFNLAEHFAELEVLKLQGDTIIFRNLFSVLPPRLTILSLSGMFDDQITHDIVNIIPRSLTNLYLESTNRLSSQSTDFIVGVHFPPCLESLFFNLSWSVLVSPSLPESLKVLKMMVSEVQPVPDFWPHLPKNLTILNTNSPVLSRQRLLGLPRTLTDLNIATNDPLTDELVSALPPNLTAAGWYSTTSRLTSVESFKQLPRSLKAISDYTETISYPIQAPRTEVLPFLPPTLTRLSFRCAVDQSDISLLPATITRLDIHLTPGRIGQSRAIREAKFGNSASPSSGIRADGGSSCSQTIEQGVSSDPTLAVDLDTRAQDLQPDSLHSDFLFDIWPSALKHLIVRGLRDKDIVIDNLPDSLTAVASYWSALKAVTKFEILDFETLCFGLEVLVPDPPQMLPHTLTRLCLGTLPSSWRVFLNESHTTGGLSFLQNLTSFSCLDSTVLITPSPAFFKHLPSSLNNIRMKILPGFDVECLKLLPRALTLVDITCPALRGDRNEVESSLIDEDMLHLPPECRIAHLPYSKGITKKAFEFLPRPVVSLRNGRQPHRREQPIPRVRHEPEA
jgi:hypothetical protein